MNKIIIDTNVLFSSLYSASGASYKLLNLIVAGDFEIILSTPLLFEYEDVLKRNQFLLNLDSAEIEIILDNLCSFAQFQKVYFLWRPYLSDPKDDMVLELAVAANVKTIVTHNLKDFASIDKFGVEAITPKAFLERLK
jgi:putative PIN family toxin of toxin-antitoxin system